MSTLLLFLVEMVKFTVKKNKNVFAKIDIMFMDQDQYAKSAQMDQFQLLINNHASAQPQEVFTIHSKKYARTDVNKTKFGKIISADVFRNAIGGKKHADFAQSMPLQQLIK